MAGSAGEGVSAVPQVLGSVAQDGAYNVVGDAQDIGDRVTGVINGLIYDRTVLSKAVKTADIVLTNELGQKWLQDPRREKIRKALKEFN